MRRVEAGLVAATGWPIGPVLERLVAVAMREERWAAAVRAGFARSPRVSVGLVGPWRRVMGDPA